MLPQRKKGGGNGGRGRVHCCGSCPKPASRRWLVAAGRGACRCSPCRRQVPSCIPQCSKFNSWRQRLQRARPPDAPNLAGGSFNGWPASQGQSLVPDAPQALHPAPSASRGKRRCSPLRARAAAKAFMNWERRQRRHGREATAAGSETGFPPTGRRCPQRPRPAPAAPPPKRHEATAVARSDAPAEPMQPARPATARRSADPVGIHRRCRQRTLELGAWHMNAPAPAPLRRAPTAPSKGRMAHIEGGWWCEAPCAAAPSSAPLAAREESCDRRPFPPPWRRPAWASAACARSVLRPHAWSVCPSPACHCKARSCPRCLLSCWTTWLKCDRPRGLPRAASMSGRR